jgi:hypothetical protein
MQVIEEPFGDAFGQDSNGYYFRRQ